MIGDLAARLTRKSRSNFYYAFLALPKPRRDALYAVYAFCRTVDDIADLGRERGDDLADQRRALARWRRDVALCYEPGGRPDDPIARGLAEAVRAFAITRDAPSGPVGGLPGQIRVDRGKKFLRQAVSAAMGAFAVPVTDLIFGYTDPRAREYAVDLGTALQLTNIIRDVGADARAGRVYVPQEDLRKFGVSADDLLRGRHTEPFVQLMRHQAERARRFYRAAHDSFPAVDARSLVPAEIMGRIYFALLEEIEARRFRVFDERITVPTGRKVAIAFRCWAAARFGSAPRRGRAA